MISVTGVSRAAGVAMAFLLVACAARADTHAPWPTDWNNWNDPALWVTVGNPGNAGEWSGGSYGGWGLDRICGAVHYEYNIGKFEVTAGQYTAFLNAVAKTDTYGLYHKQMDTAAWLDGCNIKRDGSSGNYTYSVASDWANRPVNWVSWGDAARFANWLTNGQPTGAQDGNTTEDGSYYLNGAISNAALQAVVRKANANYVIPTEDEWYKAAYHKNDGIIGSYFDYATANDSVPSNALLDPDPGNNANVSPGGTMTIGGPYYRTPVGEFENSESPYGTFDQGGNIWEWTETIISAGREKRGGSFNHGDDLLHAAARYQHFPTGVGSDFGFRIAQVPEPATLALLAVGGLVALRRRR